MTITSDLPRRAVLPTPSGDVTAAAVPPLLDIVVPVYNEQTDLGPSVRRLRTYLDARFPFPARITIVDNASTDDTWAIAAGLAAELPGVVATHLPEKGRGRALRAAWLASDATILAYMDVDLSTDLAALLPLVAPIVSGHSEMAIGSRLAPGARVVRGAKREFISRSYNRILRTVLRNRFRDAQCGFKAIRADVARRLLPAVRDEAWFFDTELLVLAERAGARIHEVPVDWTDDPDSRVAIVPTALADLRGVGRLLGDGLAGRAVPDIGRPQPRGASAGLRRLARFVAVGLVSTAAYVVLFSFLRGSMTAPLANLVALAVTAVGNTAVNRRYTFGVRGTGGLLADHAAGILSFALALGITTASIALLRFVAPGAGRTTELAVLVAANIVATLSRFTILRTWMGRPDRRASGEPVAVPVGTDGPAR